MKAHPSDECLPDFYKTYFIFYILLPQVKRYFISFWNGVDLRYRLLKGPRIRISIAGIIISRVSNPKSIFASSGIITQSQQRLQLSFG